MSLIEKSPRIKLIIWFLGLPTSSPIRLSGLIYIIGLALWGIFVYVKEVYLQITLVIFTGIISFLFLTFVITLMFPPAKRIKNILDAYGDDPKIILFTAKEVKKWLEKVINYTEKQPNPKDIKEAIEPPLISNRLEKLQKRFLKPSSTKRLRGRLEKKGNYLNDLISGVSASFRIPREPLEELINTKVDVNQKIGNEIIVSYDQIEGNIKELEDARDKINEAKDTTPKDIIDSYNRIITYCERRIKERTSYLKSREGSLNTQIKWIKELDKRREAISTLLEIIKEPSTGKAVSKLSRLLYERVNTVEDLIWLIRFANSRKGVKISELLGLKIMKGDGNETLKWYGTTISQKNLQALKEKFLRAFVRQRSEALEELWRNFREWNKDTKKIDFTQPVAVGLTYGYSAAIKKILQGICKEEDVSRLSIILIKSNEVPGNEEILRAELTATDCPGLKCDIMPIEVIEKKEIQRKIDNIFVGVENINKQGDIVHPRGGSEIIRKIKEYRKDIKVYAIGESYKVQDFTEEDIDYTKLSLFRNKNIDFVVTDHGVHERVRGEKYLFCINAKFERKLNQNIIPEELKDTFKIKGFPLPEKVAVTKEKENEWAITNEEEFIVKKENGNLNIYGGNKWRIGGELKENLDCCAQHWKENYIKEFLSLLK